MGARAAAPAASTGCSVKGSPGEPWQAETMRTLKSGFRSAIPIGVLHADCGCGGRIGRQAKKNDRRCTPFRPLLCLAERMDEPPQPTHRASRVDYGIITGPANH